MEIIGLKKKLDEAMLVKVSRMKPVIKPTKPHKHAGYHELIYLSRGSGIHSIDDKLFEVKPFDGFYLSPGSVHCWDFSQIPDGFVILFREGFLNNYPTTLNGLFKLSRTFGFSGDGELIHLVERFYNLYKAGESHEILSAYLNLIIIKTISLEGGEAQIDDFLLADFYTFKKLIDEHFLELRKVSDYADLMKISTHRLNNICQSVMQSSAQNIIKERMIIEAKNLISHTSLTISEIAYQLDFSDASNFNKFFKSLTAMTPLAYRAASL